MSQRTSEALTAARARVRERIREHRIAAGLTQRQAATAARANPSVWNAWESGSRSPSLAYLPKAASALGIPLESLFCEDGFVPLATFVLSPESVARLTSPATRERALDELHAALSAQLRIELEKAQPLKPATHGRAKRRRTREEMLLAQAQRFEALKARERRPRTVE